MSKEILALVVFGWLASAVAKADDTVSHTLYIVQSNQIDPTQAHNKSDMPQGDAALWGIAGNSEARTLLSHQLSPYTASVYAYLGGPSESGANSALPSAWQWLNGISDLDSAQFARGAMIPGLNPQGVTVGYAWRKVKIEGSAFSIGNRDDSINGKRDLALLDATSSRVSYRPTTNWNFQYSRGHLSNLDQLESRDELRRTALSASYIQVFSDGDWRTTIAWGRSNRKSTGSAVGYLLESTFRFHNVHTVFAQLERARNTEDSVTTENAQRQISRTNKLTMGYFYDVSRSGPLRYDVGALVTHYLTPPVEGPYRNDPVSGMMFVRLWLP